MLLSGTRHGLTLASAPDGPASPDYINVCLRSNITRNSSALSAAVECSITIRTYSHPLIYRSGRVYFATSRHRGLVPAGAGAASPKRTPSPKLEASTELKSGGRGAVRDRQTRAHEGAVAMGSAESLQRYGKGRGGGGAHAATANNVRETLELRDGLVRECRRQCRRSRLW